MRPSASPVGKGAAVLHRLSQGRPRPRTSGPVGCRWFSPRRLDDSNRAPGGSPAVADLLLDGPPDEPGVHESTGADCDRSRRVRRQCHRSRRGDDLVRGPAPRCRVCTAGPGVLFRDAAHAERDKWEATNLPARFVPRFGIVIPPCGCANHVRFLYHDLTKVERMMAKYPSARWTERDRGWLALVGLGLAAALYETWSWAPAKRRRHLAAREHARIVPLRQARMEADWTRQAVSYAGGAKGG